MSALASQQAVQEWQHARLGDKAIIVWDIGMQIKKSDVAVNNLFITMTVNHVTHALL